LSSGLEFEFFDVFGDAPDVCLAPPVEALPLLAPLFGIVAVLFDIVVFRACSCIFIMLKNYNTKFKFTNIKLKNSNFKIQKIK
jgi:hypothetical protein